MKNQYEIEESCREPLDKRHVTQRTQSGTTLDYVDQYYVIRRLGEVFGPLGFSTEVVELTCHTAPYEATSSSGKMTWRVGYRCTMRLTARFVDSQSQPATVTKEDVGYGTGIDRDLNLAHESAGKEAATDALKRCARLLGDSFGLALYDKTKAHVENGAERAIRLAREGRIAEAKEAAKADWAQMPPDYRERVKAAIAVAEKAARPAEAAE